jgi:hypothetical protein
MTVRHEARSTLKACRRAARKRNGSAGFNDTILLGTRAIGNLKKQGQKIPILSKSYVLFRVVDLPLIELVGGHLAQCYKTHLIHFDLGDVRSDN